MEKVGTQISSLIEPHPSVQGARKRQQSRLLSSLLLLAIPIFSFVQFTSELVIFSTPIFLGAVLLVFILYLGTRTKYYDVVKIITLGGITILPTILFLYGANWQPNDLPRLMVWFLVALIGGTLLSRTIIVLLQGITMISMMTLLVALVFGVPFVEFGSHVGTAVVITFFVLVVSYTLDQYVTQLEQQNAENTRKQWELEVYTQLLRHDLRNDLQAVLGSIEVAELFVDLDINKVKKNLSQSLSLGGRMVQLLHIFSMPLEQPGTDLIKNIEEAAEEAQKTHRDLTVEISTDSKVRKTTFTASRLLPMVWQNIFRNAAQYAGFEPKVMVDITLNDNNVFVITISDNGPGIPLDKRKYLFRRGSEMDFEEHGLGLYLSKIVLESHRGSIELIEDNEGNGTRLLIKIPTS
jgi:signal transduction histidine kinase